MSLSLILVCSWVILAHVMAMIPSKDSHWRRAFILIVLGIPLLGFVTWQNGPWVGLICLAAGMSILRWPMYFLARWVRRQLTRSESNRV
ncbi:DUF2484 family protein [Pelagovum pacificum]|uniref:DUF2484 family protein n=1 Tax=Pelagovum pacificum TaxID=2588711 RepID=A0A5C5G9I4_9RHOB|nr:DUF2484 family protein [Pelagovum pacificum]QQA41842.1 DUF2484 family protein [Pelagovum pacificum]TNY30715.1 DUF2484 family protein [Pelagovum pacificum]